jgi:hypothetical protein
MRVFSEVVLVCHELKLIQGNMFVIDGCRLPSNASKEWSGTRSELGKKHEKIQKMLGALPEQHRQADAGGLGEGKQRKLQRLDQAARRIRTFPEHHEDRTGAGGEPVKSNVTDNESEKIKGPHGVIQGYDGLAVADSKNQIILAAQANGTVAEGQYFAAAPDEAAGNLRRVSGKRKPLEGGQRY